MSKNSTMQPIFKNLNLKAGETSQNSLLSFRLLVNSTKTLMKETKIYGSDSIEVAQNKIVESDDSKVFTTYSHIDLLVKLADRITSLTVTKKKKKKKISKVGELFTICEDYLDRHSR
ncbi:MAG: hypothetical protein JJV93_02500 [Alphaproteobacteria bacterium]|nr:hypothetical protein [Alphaproteobacteria bacterium]MBL0718102.1 hypothetical protein [Alphaproteobacteria bacterium]